jgi:CDP-4-dehydro-6-deoxyglucose reductase
MPSLLPVFRAARLVGVTRRSLQKKIHNGELNTFEGMIQFDDLLRLYPNADISPDSEFERIQNIKSQAFARRVRERLLPSAEVLINRISSLGEELASTRAQVGQYQNILDEITAQLSAAKHPLNDKDISNLLHWIKNKLTEPLPTNTAEHDLLTRDTMLRIMTTHITIQPSGHEFWLEGNDSLLDAGVRSGLSLDYGCASGNCGLCKARVVSGEVSKICHHDYVLSEAEKSRNYILMCSCTAVSDVVLEALEASGENDIPPQEITTKVKKLHRPNPDMLILHLQTPRTQRMRFLAGQSATLSITEDQHIDFPIASCPCDDRNILFHIEKQTHNASITHLFENTQKGDEITLTGPHGNFLFQEESQRSPIFIAYGIGFAPIKSLIEHAMALEVAETMYLYWVVNKDEDLYIHNLCRSWDDALEDFVYQPIIGEDPLPKILLNHPDLSQCNIYLAGNETQVTSAKTQLLTAGLPSKQLVSEISNSPTS